MSEVNKKKQLPEEVTSSETIKPLSPDRLHRQKVLLEQSIRAVRHTDEK
ncbi:hypothetical protein [Fructobacillus cardui]|nr:hypothetical protein [Fructobacillus cardui]MCK8626700.1 hypothetical protein [Fructobacillus cardui]